MKAYTDLEQSKKLEGILPIGSNDMFYEPSAGFNTQPSEVRFGNIKYAHPLSIPCWSLAALRACLPPGISIDGILYVFESHNTFDNEWVYEYKFEDISASLYSKSKNEIDACVNMIIQLKENKMI